MLGPLQSAGVTDSPDDPHAEPVVIAAFSDVGEAEVVQAKLRAYGIESFVDDQVEGGVLRVESEGLIAVLVRAADADDARQALADGGESADEDQA
jgi:hypothetical protein